MTMNKILVAAAVLLLGFSTSAGAQPQTVVTKDGIYQIPQNRGSYATQSYPQGFDQEYRVPNSYGTQYYQQEPESVVGYHGNQRTAQADEGSQTYHQQYYYY